MNTQLLITFVKSKKLLNMINDITSCYMLAFNKIYILENMEDTNELICSYNIDGEYKIDKYLIPKNTISVHRRKDTNTIYTINALNYVIALHNDGIVDMKFAVPWNTYRNMVLVTNVDGLKKIHTKIHSIIDI